MFKLNGLQSSQAYQELKQAALKAQAELEATKEERAAEEAAKQKADLERRYLSAGIPPRFLNATLDNYKPINADAKRTLEAVQEFAQCFDPKDPKSLLFQGGVGTGKTHLAAALTKSLLDKGFRVRYSTIFKIMERYKASFNSKDETPELIIQELTSLDLLILDEIGVQYGSNAEELFLFQVIDARYNNLKPTILIGNAKINGIVGQRVFDRLREGGRLVVFNWDSYRRLSK